MRVANPIAWLVTALLAAGCGEDPVAVVPADVGVADSSDVEDIGPADASDASDTAADTVEDNGHDALPDAVEDVGQDAADDAADAADAGDAVESDVTADTAPDSDVSPDADAGPSPGFGAIAGSCGVIAGELDDATGSFFEATIDFADDPFDDPEDLERLTAGGLDVLEAGNSGGSSLYSEVFAFEVLARCDGASLLETERTIEYDPEHAGSITDLLVLIDGQQVGVSVTRAVGFPRDEPYTVERATDLLSGKLEDILESSAGVVDEDAWVKQVLFVIAYADGHVDSLRAAIDSIEDEVRADTVVFVVESLGMDEWLY